MQTKTVGDHTYRFNKLDARQQFHLLRKLSPVLIRLEKLPGLLALARDVNMQPEDRAGLFMAAMAPAVEALATLPDHEVDQIINLALRSVQRLEADNRGAPVVADSGLLMYQDITMQHMLELTWHAVQENLGNFFDLVAAVTN